MALRASRFGSWVAALAGAAMVFGTLVWFYYPAVPKSTSGWILLFVLGIPTWLAIERLGGVVLGAKFFSRMGSFGRIALGVPVLLALAAIAGVAIWLGQRVIAAA